MLILILILFGLGYWLGKSSQVGSSQQTTDVTSSNLQKIINALVFAARDEQKKSTNKSTTEAIQRIIDAGYVAQYGRVPDSQVTSEGLIEQTAQTRVATTTQTANVQQPFMQRSQQQIDRDNTSLLLYFGAFLFITAIGLFVAFGGLQGAARTFLVACVAIAMYGFGFWLHGRFEKLTEAALAFIAIGMSALPFVGVAAYYFIYNEEKGPLIWFTTSVFSFGIYLFTLLRLRNTFISYMLIACIVSLFQSLISVIEAPVYYYVWGFMGVGLLLHAVSIFTTNLPELKDSSRISSRLLIPLTILGSFFVVENEGFWQLAVTLCIGSIYYLLQFFDADTNREDFSAASHILALLGLAVGSYSLNESFGDVATYLLLISLVHILVIAVVPSTQNAIVVRFIDISLVATIAAILFSLTDHTNLTTALIIAIGLGILVSVRWKRDDSFVIATACWVMLSVVLGQVLPENAITYIQQAMFSFMFTLPLLALVHFKEVRGTSYIWNDTIRLGIVGLHCIAMFYAALAGEYAVLNVALASMFTVLVLAETLHKHEWADVAVSYSLAPIAYVLYASTDTDLRALPLFTISTLALLAMNIAIALRHKREAARWLSATGWLALPFALGIEEIGPFNLNAHLQMWLFVLAALVLAISRAIARGRIMLTSNTPLASLDRESSYSYEVGVAVAASIAVILAFTSQDNVTLSTVVVLLAGAITVVTGSIIERTPQYVMIIPVILQVALFRALEPYSSATWVSSLRSTAIEIFVLSSIVLAMTAYVFVVNMTTPERYQKYLESLRDAAFWMLFVAPFSIVIFWETVWPMPLGLIIAAALMIYENWSRPSQTKEGIGMVGVAGIFWWMAYLGVTNIQAYAHVLAAVLALYAYLRARTKDWSGRNDYIMYMLFTATIPLVIQALAGGNNADFYGYWLLLENIGFFMLGITLRINLLTRWGLYVAIGSVLYQLRGLGWAVLAVVALTMIGLAIYRLIKQSDDENSQ